MAKKNRVLTEHEKKERRDKQIAVGERRLEKADAAKAAPKKGSKGPKFSRAAKDYSVQQVVDGVIHSAQPGDEAAHANRAPGTPSSEVSYGQPAAADVEGLELGNGFIPEIGLGNVPGLTHTQRLRNGASISLSDPDNPAYEQDDKAAEHHARQEIGMRDGMSRETRWTNLSKPVHPSHRKPRGK